MIYTVTLNPSLDYIVSVNDFRMGIVNRTCQELIYPGGKGINVSLVLKNLGYDSTALGFVAGFTGTELSERLQEKGINTDFIRTREGRTRINVKIRSSKESEINAQGPSINISELNSLYERLDQLQDKDVLILGGSVPQSLPATIYMDIMNRLKLKSVKIIVDATKELLINTLKYRPFLIKPNNQELSEIFHKELTNKKDVTVYAIKLRDMGAQNVMVSMAGEGAVLVTEQNKTYMADAPEGKVKNSVGAGDSMVAGFLAGFFGSNDYEIAFKMGICAGSASAFSDTLATKEEVLAIMNSHSFL